MGASRNTGPLPETIGPYIIREKIGSGGMATVYRAYSPGDGREVALKVLAIHLADQASVRQRFEREARVLQRFHHPHILPVFDFGEAHNTPFLVMRLMSGRSLADLLEGRPLPPRRVATLVHQIAGALDYAHARNIIHRDIKPNNILLDAQGQPYLADFGVAYSGDEEDLRLTATGQFLGTAAYASPEQCRGEKLTRSSDVYALAVVAFEMATGQRPFVSTSPLAVMKAHMSEPPPNPLSFNPSLPVAVHHVLVRALAKEPRARYPSGLKFSEALAAALNVHLTTRISDDEDAWLYDDPVSMEPDVSPADAPPASSGIVMLASPTAQDAAREIARSTVGDTADWAFPVDPPAPQDADEVAQVASLFAASAAAGFGDSFEDFAEEYDSAHFGGDLDDVLVESAVSGFETSGGDPFSSDDPFASDEFVEPMTDGDPFSHASTGEAAGGPVSEGFHSGDGGDDAFDDAFDPDVMFADAPSEPTSPPVPETPQTSSEGLPPEFNLGGAQAAADAAEIERLIRQQQRSGTANKATGGRPNVIRPLAGAPPTSGTGASWRRAARPGSTRSPLTSQAQAQRGLIYAGLGIIAVLLLVAVAIIAARANQDDGGASGPPTQDPNLKVAEVPSLGLSFSYPVEWHSVVGPITALPGPTRTAIVLSDEPVQSGGPYGAASIALALTQIDPAEVFNVPSVCLPRVVDGPLQTFACMRVARYATPVHEAYPSALGEGVRLPGTLPPTPASLPMMLLPYDSERWLAVVVVHWSGDDARTGYAALDQVARSVRRAP